MQKIKIKKLRDDVILPKYQTSGAAGMDFYSGEDYDLKPGERRLFKLGFAIELEQGYEMQIRARSGWSLKYGLTAANGIGNVDSDYRDEVGIILYNIGDQVINIKKGDRIGQGVVMQYFQPTWEVVEELSVTERNGGFGSTGKN